MNFKNRVEQQQQLQIEDGADLLMNANVFIVDLILWMLKQRVKRFLS